MSATIQLNSRQLLPLKEAATAVSYSRDYVARLAREEKITAVLINRQWMIDVGSLKNFSELSQLESEVKKNHLREIRKHELAVRQEYAERLNTLQTKITSKNNTTLVHSLLVILFGIGTGLLLNFTNIYLPPGRLEVTAQLPQKTVANFLPSFITEDTTKDTNDRMVMNGVIESAGRIDMSNGIVLFSSATSSSQADITDLFSDSVVVEMTSATTGFIRSSISPDGAGLPFVRLPNKSLAVSAGDNNEIR